MSYRLRVEDMVMFWLSVGWWQPQAGWRIIAISYEIGNEASWAAIERKNQLMYSGAPRPVHDSKNVKQGYGGHRGPLAGPRSY